MPVNIALILLFSIISCSVTFAVTETSALSDQWYIEKIQVENGLPDSTIYSIAQDQSGYMWFGTTNGLARFDGYSFKIFRHDGADLKTISNNNAGNLFIDSKNTLWIGTFGGGVNTLNLNNGKLFRHPYSNSQINKQLSENVQTFYEDKAGNIWVGTATGLYRINGDELTHYDYQFSDPNSLSHSRVWDITEDADGNILVGTSDGLSQLDVDSGQFENHKLPDKLTLDISSNQFRTLLAEQDLVWVGSSSGLFSFNVTNQEFEFHSPNYTNIKINDIYPVADDLLLIASMEGLYEFNIKHNSFTIKDDGEYWHPLSQYDVRDIYVDHSDQMWLATRDSGVIKVNQTNGLFQLKDAYLHESEITDKAKHIWSIEPDFSGGLLFGTSDTIFIKNASSEFKRVDNESLNSIPGIIRDVKHSNDGGYWIGSSGGLYYLSGNETNAQTVNIPFELAGIEPTDVFSVEETENGELWLALYNVGILRWHPESNRAALIQNYADGPLTDLNISHITLDKQGNIWIASNLVGVFNYNFVSKQLVLYSHDYNDKNSISSNRVKDIFKDSKGRLWIATTRGLNQFMYDTNTFKHYTYSNGLLSDSVLNVIEDSEQNLWLGYKFGISHFNPDNQEVNNYVLNTAIRNDGFIARSAAVDEDNILYFGSANGYYIFDPKDIESDVPFQPKLMLTDIKINNRALTFEQLLLTQNKLELDHNDSLISFKFSALDYKSPEQIQYLYRLIGLHEDWLDVSVSRSVELNNLKSGDYQLEIKAINNDGRWKEQLLDIGLSVSPAWWNRAWVQAIFVLTAILLALAIHYYRTYKIRKQNLTLESEVNIRTTELQDLNNQLEVAANSDYLTGLPNRMAFINSYEQRQKLTAYKNLDCCIVLADIDHFKVINDQHGHLAGDDALVQIAQVLHSLIRSEDLIARWGGEEFIFYFENMNSEATYNLVERIREKIESIKIHYKGTIIPITITFGVCQKHKGMTLLDCINAADESMYLGKSQGRNKVVVAPNI